MTLAEELNAQDTALQAAIAEVVRQRQGTTDPGKLAALDQRLTELEVIENKLLALQLQATSDTLSSAAEQLVRSQLALQRNALQNVIQALSDSVSGLGGGEEEGNLDAAFSAEPVVLLPAVAAAGTGGSAFDQFFQDQLPDIQHFTPGELLTKGASNSPGGSCAGLNTDPPAGVWQNVVPLVRVLERFRQQIGHPVKLLSVYRSPAYNTCVGGAGSSQHMLFKAADIKVAAASGTEPADWQTILKAIRSSGAFQGGIGRYGSFVHVDVRGTNADWTG